VSRSKFKMDRSIFWVYLDENDDSIVITTCSKIKKIIQRKLGNICRKGPN